MPLQHACMFLHNLPAMERGLMHTGMDCLASTSSPLAGRCVGLHSSASPSQRAVPLTPRCLARSQAPGQGHRAAHTLRAATVEAPAVDQNGEGPSRDFRRTESIREQAHRRGKVFEPSYNQGMLKCRAGAFGRGPFAVQTPSGGRQVFAARDCNESYLECITRQAAAAVLAEQKVRQPCMSAVLSAQAAGLR